MIKSTIENLDKLKKSIDEFKKNLERNYASNYKGKMVTDWGSCAQGLYEINVLQIAAIECIYNILKDRQMNESLEDILDAIRINNECDDRTSFRECLYYEWGTEGQNLINMTVSIEDALNLIHQILKLRKDRPSRLLEIRR